ncbi:saxitoxin and tetrodotoxin-binding protein 1-like [Pholidichthys leucotaenia]
MAVIHVASFLLSLLPLTAAAPAADDCSQLTRPLRAEEVHKILGKWILFEGLAKAEIVHALSQLESTWMVFNTTADNETLWFETVVRLVPQPIPPIQGDHCFRVNQTMTLVDGEDLEFFLAAGESYCRFLQTCPDCLVIHTYNKVNEFQTLYLFGRKKTVADSDLKTFRKQGECLHFPLPAKFHYDPNNNLCP